MPVSPTLRAEVLGATLPPLVVAADRVASTILQGVHGRRRSGQGDAFWQFRPFLPGDQASRVDWRQSAKSDRLFIRETEWEAAQTVALWRDASPSMAWRSTLRAPPKRERAELLLLALASLLLRGGERVRILGGPGRSHAGRAGLEALAQSLTFDAAPAGLPAVDPALPRHARCVLIGDFLEPLPEIQRAVSALAGRPVHGHLLQVLDPAEESCPISAASASRDWKRRNPPWSPASKACATFMPSGCGSIAPVSRRSPPPPAGASSPTAPTSRRVRRCWRCGRHSRQSSVPRNRPNDAVYRAACSAMP
ncbi:DUF58 domain-containing protein [Siccirubricoccus deserti]